jgi:hypothetical protein
VAATVCRTIDDAGLTPLDLTFGKPAMPGVYQLGIAVADAASGERLILASHLRKLMASAPAENPQTPAAASERMAVEEIYERALKMTVQVIVCALKDFLL